MRCTLARWLAAAATLTVVLQPALAPTPVSAAVIRPPAALASDRLVFDSNRTGRYELFAVATDGTRLQQLTNDARYDSWWPKLSPDRRTIVFYRTPAGVHDVDHAQASLWRVGVDGRNLTLLLPARPYGWALQGHAEWSPDGASLVMAGGPAAWNLQIFVTDAAGRNPVQVTHREGSNIDPSWSPDGRSLLFVGCAQAACYAEDYEVYAVNRDGTGERRLTTDGFRDHDPYWSPDGTTVAWLRESAPGRWGIHRMAADASGQRALLDDGAVNSKPAWSVESGRVFFHRSTGAGFGLFSVAATGSVPLAVPGPSTAPGLYNDEYPVNSSF